ncbi:dihydroorotate dehydrogenase, partial [Helicosporidium sp. ATCC 50920]
LLPRDGRRDPASLRTEVWGRALSNPLGLAAGFDKSAEAMEGALDLGFGFVEVGSVTPLPQPGNPKPRVFRLPSAGAIINRYGFNNDGIDAVKSRLERFRERARAPRASHRLRSGLVGVNVGKNKTTSDGAADFCAGVSALAPLADYLVVNVSSPNTPGLRALQSRAALEQLLRRVLAARDGLAWDEGPAPPLLLKIAPDLGDDELRDVAAVALETGVDGLIVSNTTVERPPGVRELEHGQEAGG